MPSSDALVAIVTALAADLDTNAGLPQHNTFRFRRPRALLPEYCPAMVVWLDLAMPDHVTTQVFDSNVRLGISWHEESVEEAQELLDDDVLSQSLITNIGLIKKRVESLITDMTPLEVQGWPIGVGGGPAAWEMMVGKLDAADPGDEQGLTEGHRLEVLVAVTE